MRAGLDASTVTPGITAPELSLTVPAMAPVLEVWADASMGASIDRVMPRPTTNRIPEPNNCRIYLFSSVTIQQTSDNLLVNYSYNGGLLGQRAASRHRANHPPPFLQAPVGVGARLVVDTPHATLCACTP